jgi:hypothetical protein
MPNEQYLVAPPLRGAVVAGQAPYGRPRARPGPKGDGLRYQRALGNALGALARAELWYEFEDRNGTHFCQPDFVIFGHKRVCVLEAKLTFTPEGLRAIKGLYKPVCEHVYGRHTFGFVVCKNLPREVPPDLRICGTFVQAVEYAQEGVPTALQWLPKTPLRAA